MKHLKYIALILFVWLGAACEQLPLPNTELTIKSEIVTEVTANSAVIEVEFNPTAATIQNVYACYTSTEKTVMKKVSDLKYRVNLLALDNNTEYHVHYMVTNSFSSVTLQNNLSFTTAVNKPSNVIDTVYHIDFTQTMGAWTIKNYLLSGGLTSVWFRSDKYGMKASAFLGTNHASEAWLISSPLDLTSNTTAFLTFNQAYKYGDISQFAVKITKNGLDWTTLEVPTWPDGTSWDFINSGEIDITKYISANTQIAFAYTSSAEASPTWEIKDVLIKGNGTRIEEPTASVTAPTVVTSAVTQIAETTAVAGGNVTSDGGTSSTERGVVYSTNPNPVITNLSNTILPCGSGAGSFTCNLTGLQPNTTYYIRAYAKNDVGTAYGDEVSFTTKEEVVATPEYVDLGLSVKWATFNVGANKPEDYGDYFAWGEVEPKEIYNWSTYKYCNGSETTLTKYNTDSSRGTVDNKTQLELSDDAARANWGGEWRTPTDAELTELRTQCTWTWTTQNGVNGYKVTSKSNSNSIFLPAAGCRLGSSLRDAGSFGYFWSSSLSTVNAYRLSFSSSNVNWSNGNRYYGQSVCPVYGSQSEQTTAPTVVTSAVTQITETSAVVGGNVTSDGGASVTERGVVYSTSANPTTANSKVASGSGTGAFTCNLTGLQPNTTYYVRAYAVNSKGTSYGEQVTFTTLTPIVVPTVMTSTITQITETTAVAGGNVTSDGGASVTERGVVYSTSTNPTTASNKVISGSGMGAFTCNLTGLQPNTTYYVRAYAVNSKGTSYGEQVTFTTLTPIVVPTVMTSTITQITETTAVAGGNVTSDGGTSSTERGVVYSTNPNPVITNLSNTILPCGSGAGSFTCNLTGLQPNTTYYIRAYAKNDAGTAYGEEMSFTTQIQKPTTPYFSVSETKNVTFSSGNLQYHPANKKWRFAENQTDYVGNANNNISSSYKGWIDLFGWSTSATKFGASTSTDWENDYLGSFVDWGTNTIGNDAPNTWRTLTNNEWNYLLNTRTNADDLVGVAQVNGVNGLIFLPDNWVCPSGVTFKSGFHSSEGVDYYAAYQTFTAAEWSKLEVAGAVFLPAAGLRYGSNMFSVQNYGGYWSATEYDSFNAYYLLFDSDDARMSNRYRYNGHSVRLVKDL